jgi:UDP-N-acetylmuramoyl-L-alanyl-D-glutamate--2,6-diaminopimelate ligase
MGARIGARDVPLDRTTPEAVDLQRLLREMVDAGLRHAVVEVASHALALRRVDGTRFAAAVFTNLTQDHLDFHKSLEEYRAAKRRLFAMVEPDGVAVINADDPHGAVMASASRAPVLTYAIDRDADLVATGLRLHLGGSDYTLRTRGGEVPVTTRLHGRFNVYNALAAAALARHYGADPETIRGVLAAFPGVPGRFEAVDEGQAFGVVVDYAHTPDGLQNVLRTAKDFVRGRTIVVFGAGGDRDRTKRPVMGAIAAALADVAVVTSDNPRTEEPGAIIDQILAGMREGTAQIEVEPDRRRAIGRAVALARPGDFIIIAGKGHEPYQEIHGTKHPFDDRLVAREALRARPE